MTKRREPLRLATRKPRPALFDEARQLQRIAAGISMQHGMLPAITDLQVLREHLDALEVEAVAIARAGGRSWEDIARALGVSRQTAHARFSPVVATSK